MAFLDNSSNFQKNQEYLMGNDARPAPTMDHEQRQRDASKSPTVPEFQAMTTGAGGSQGSGGVSSAPEMDMQTTSAPQTNTQVEEKKPDGTVKTTSTNTQPIFKTTGSMNQRLQNPISGAAQQGQNRLQQASEVFNQMAGPSRSFESVGGADTLNTAVEQGTGVEDARALADARYAGPSGLDQGELASLQNLYGDLSQRTKAMGTGGGLATLIQQSSPGLTKGEAMFESKRRLDQDEQTARDLRHSTVNPLRAQVEAQAGQARDFAAQRGQEEDLIRESSRGLLTGRGDTIDSDLQRAMDSASAQQEAATGAWGDIQDSDNTRADLKKYGEFLQQGTTENPGDVSGADVAKMFNTPGFEKSEEGKALMEKIMADPKYAAIKGYDPLGKTITTRGKEFYGTKDDDGRVTDLRATEKDKGTRGQLYQRQKEMEAAFGKGGEFNTTNALYHGGDGYQADDPKSYLGFDPGTSPARENVSSEVQTTQYNRVMDLLGSLDKIGEQQPFRAAKIFADAERYLQNEEETLEGIKGDLSTSQKQWKNKVKRARKDYKKKKKSAKYAKIGAIVGGILFSGGAQGADPAVGAGIGAGVGASAGSASA